MYGVFNATVTVIRTRTVLPAAQEGQPDSLERRSFSFFFLNQRLVREFRIVRSWAFSSLEERKLNFVIRRNCGTLRFDHLLRIAILTRARRSRSHEVSSRRLSLATAVEREPPCETSIGRANQPASRTVSRGRTRRRREPSGGERRRKRGRERMYS